MCVLLTKFHYCCCSSLAVDHEADDNTRAGPEGWPAEQVEAAPQLRAQTQEPLVNAERQTPRAVGGDVWVRDDGRPVGAITEV